MKRFYYIITETKPTKLYGGRYKYANIYTVKAGKIIYCCKAHWHTSSYRGEKSEVFQALMANGYIPKKYETSSKCDWRGAGYFAGIVADRYEINELTDY